MSNQYTTVEAAKILGLQPRTIRSHIERGVIAATKQGRDHFIDREELERFQRERRSPGKPRKGTKQAQNNRELQ